MGIYNMNYAPNPTKYNDITKNKIDKDKYVYKQIIVALFCILVNRNEHDVVSVVDGIITNFDIYSHLRPISRSKWSGDHSGVVDALFRVDSNDVINRLTSRYTAPAHGGTGPSTGPSIGQSLYRRFGSEAEAKK